MSNKLEDVLLAGCLGDAIGYAVEFKSWKQIQAEFGHEGIKELHASEFATIKMPGLRQIHEYEASDDTQMTLFAAEAITLVADGEVKDDFPFSAKRIMQSTQWAFQAWYETQNTSGFDARSPFSKTASAVYNQEVMWKQQAPGNTCLSALADGGYGEIDCPVNNSKGCGTIMRTAPFAFLYDYEDVFDLGAAQGAMTHGHRDGWVASAAFTEILASILRGNDLRTAASLTLNLLITKNLTSTNTYALLSSVLDYNGEILRYDDMTRKFGEGWVADECLAVAVYCALNNKTVAETIIHAANHSGDSDSTASCAAQLTAAEFGLTNFERVDALLVDLGPLTSKIATQMTASLAALKHVRSLTEEESND